MVCHSRLALIASLCLFNIVLSAVIINFWDAKGYCKCLVQKIFHSSCSLHTSCIKSTYGAIMLSPWVNYAMKCVDCSSIFLFKSSGDFCCLPVHFSIGRICFCSKCSIHHTFVPSTLPICFPCKWNVWIAKSPCLHS